MDSDVNTFLSVKRKSKRRSSISTGEALKLISLTGNKDDKDILEEIAMIQFNWIEKQWENLKHHSKLATKLASVSNSGFTTASLNNLEEESNDQTYKKDFEQLSSAHKDFLRTYDISQDQIENSLKKMKISLIKSELNRIKKKESAEEKRLSYLKKKLSRSSMSSACSLFISNMGSCDDTKGPSEIAWEFFNL